MPTTQPLDEDDLGDIFEGPFKPIAGFAQPQAQPRGEAPRARVTTLPPQKGPKLQITNLRTPNLGLRTTTVPESDNPQPKAPQEVQTAAVVRTTPYTDGEVVKAWEQFISHNKAEHLLTNAMRVSSPTRTSPDRYRIAQSKIHLRYIRENLNRLTDYVRNVVQNDNLIFYFEEVSEDSPLAWSERDLITHMIEKNPSLSDFITKLNLSIL